MPSLRKHSPVPRRFPAQPIDDAAYLLDRSEEARTIAAGMRHPGPRRQMLSIAETYKRLAEHAYWRATRK